MRARYGPRIIVSYAILVTTILFVGLGLPLASGVANGASLREAFVFVPNYWAEAGRAIRDAGQSVFETEDSIPAVGPIPENALSAEGEKVSRVLPTERALVLEGLVHALVNAER